MKQDKQNDLDEIMRELGKASAQEQPEEPDRNENASPASQETTAAAQDPRSNGPSPAEDEEEDTYEDDEEYEEEELPRPKKRRRTSVKKLIFGLILAVVIVGISLGLAYTIITAGMDMLGIDKSDDPVSVQIPQNASTEEIAAILESSGIIRQPVLFRVISRLQKADGSYQYGDFLLKPSMPYEDIILSLQKSVSKRDSVRLSFPEGYTMEKIGAVLEENEVCSAEDFLEAANRGDYGYAFESGIVSDGLRYNKMEGYIFPDTYDFYKGEAAESVVKRFFAQFNKKVTASMYTRAQELNMSMDEVITLASIIQLEASVKGGEQVLQAEMKKVSSVFHNRLKATDKFPKLQSDPTRKYVEDTLIPAISSTDQSLYEPVFKAYNTYEGEGLPPGPVCNPGIFAIEAALYPEYTDYYFFCSNLTTHEFYYAETNAQHEANLVKAGLK